MSYQVIARKYRPQRFGDVVGQEHVTQTLSHAIEQNRIAHAYLFCGPRGTGKTTIARIFAKCLNCTGGPKVDFDDSDPRCREIAEGRSLDVMEIDAASNRGIDEIRGLRETVKYAPASSKFKIYIIDEVHMLTKEAFNALLKTLEEPPEHVKFMFATTEPEKVLPTILSRCQRFDLRRIPAPLIVQHLSSIAETEKVQIAPTALVAIARGAEGCMRDAESTLDQLISFCGSTIEENDVLTMFGLTAQAQLTELSRALLAGEVEPALRQLNELARHGKDLARLLSDLLNHFRNLLIYRVSRGDVSMLEVTEGEAALLKEQSEMVSQPALAQIMDVFADAELKLRDAVSKKTLVEVTLLKAIDARNAISIDALLQQLESLRGGSGEAPAPAREPVEHRAASSGTRMSSSAPVPKNPSRATASAIEPGTTSAPISPATPIANRPGAGLQQPSSAPEVTSPEAQTSNDALEPLWSALLEAVGRESAFTRTYLLEAHPVSIDAKWLVIGFGAEFEDHIALVDNPRNQKLLQTKLAELDRPNLQVRFVKAEPPRGRKPGTSARPAVATKPVPPLATAKSAPATEKPHSPKPSPMLLSKEDFKNDPLIQKALEIFKGQIVDIRA